MADPTPPAGGDLGALVKQLLDLKRRVDDLESASGTQRYQSVAKLQALIDDIQAQLDAWVLTRWTNAQISAQIANPPSPGVAATGDVSATNDVTAGASLRGQNLYAIQAPGFNITGTRVAAWLETATGRLGTASSSRRYKQDEAPSGIDPVAVLSIEPKRFRYIEQVQQFGDDAAVEVGFIAEDLEAAGLTPWVVHRDIDGETVPDGVEYSTFAVAHQSVLRDLDARDKAKQEQIDVLTARINALETGGTNGSD